MTNAAITYMLIQLLIKQLPLVVTQYLFHASTTRDHAQLRPKDAIILQFLHCLDNVTWNIRLYSILSWSKIGRILHQGGKVGRILHRIISERKVGRILYHNFKEMNFL